MFYLKPIRELGHGQYGKGNAVQACAMAIVVVFYIIAVIFEATGSDKPIWLQLILWIVFGILQLTIPFLVYELTYKMSINEWAMRQGEVVPELTHRREYYEMGTLNTSQQLNTKPLTDVTSSQTGSRQTTSQNEYKSQSVEQLTLNLSSRSQNAVGQGEKIFSPHSQQNASIHQTGFGNTGNVVVFGQQGMNTPLTPQGAGPISPKSTFLTQAPFPQSVSSSSLTNQSQSMFTSNPTQNQQYQSNNQKSQKKQLGDEKKMKKQLELMSQDPKENGTKLIKRLKIITKNKNKALEALRNCKTNIPNMIERFLIYCLLRDLEQSSSSKSGSGGQANQQGVAFRQKLAHAQRGYELSRAYLTQAYLYLSRDNLDLVRIMNFLDKAIDNEFAAHDLFDDLMKTFSNSVEVLRAYGALLRDIYREDDTALMMFNEANAIEEDLASGGGNYDEQQSQVSGISGQSKGNRRKGTK
ncbi:MAG: hypothetical protein EZS28_015895, partial [Streblomastix strix]